MHSTNGWRVSNFVLVLSVAFGGNGAFQALPASADDRAGRQCFDPENPPVPGSNFEKYGEEYCRLQEEIEALKVERSATTDEAAKGLLTARINSGQLRFDELDRILSQSGKKLFKADKKIAKAEKKEMQISELEAMKVGKSPEEIAKLDQEIAWKKSDAERKREKALKKEGKYTKIIGDAAPSKVAAEPPAPEVVEQDKPVPLTELELKKLDACYSKSDEPLPVKMVAHFSAGADSVVEGSSLENDQNLEKLFDKNSDAVRKTLVEAGYDKVWKTEAVGYASKVGYVSEAVDRQARSKELADARSRNISNSFTAILKMGGEDGSPAVTELNAFEANISRDDVIEYGPSAAPGEYTRLSKLPVTKDLIEQTAMSILYGKDQNARTPVRVKIPKDSTDNYYHDSVVATAKKLVECCSANQATLKFQPFQFTEIKVYGAKFESNSESCVAAAEKVSTEAYAKKVGEDLPVGAGESRQPAAGDHSGEGN